MVAIPDSNPAGVSSTISIGETGVVKQLKLSLDITHTYIGDLIVELTGPGGQKAILHNRTGAGTDNLVTSYDSMLLDALATFVGLSVQGDWVLRVQDVAGQDVGKLNRWMLDVVVEGGAQIVRGEATPNLSIPDNTSAGVSSSITLNQPGSVGQMKVSIDITHTYIGDLRIELVSPAGRRIILHSQLGGNKDNLVVTYDSMAPLSPLFSALASQPMPPGRSRRAL